jgi:tape measure domain-containing protein
VAKDVTLLIKLRDQVSGKVRAIEGASKKAEIQVKKLERAVKRTGIQLERMRRKGVEGLNAIAARAKNAAKNFGGLGKAAALAAVAAGAAAFAKFSFGAAGELERQTKSLQVLTGSLDTAKGIISELQAFGAVTPFTSQELIETSKRLKAFGFETEQVVDVTKRLADVAGATGADLSGIATAFGQIEAKGVVRTEELLQLQERGVGINEELMKMYGMTGEEFSKALEKGQISADAANVALIRLTEQGGKYANGAVAQSDTLFGKLSTLQDAFQRFGQNIGKFLSPIFKGIIDFLTTITNQINNLFRESAIDRQARKNLGIDKPGASAQFFKRGGQAKLEAEKERLRSQGFAAEPPKTPDMTIPKLRAAAAGGGGKTPEQIAAEEADKQREAVAKLVVQKKQEAQLIAATTDEEREQLKLKFDKLNLAEKFPALNDAELQSLRDQLDINFGLTKKDEERIEAAKILKQQQDTLNKLYEQTGQTISTAIVDSLMQAKSVTEALGGALQNIGRQLAQLGINTLLKSTGLGIFSALPGFANGGRPPVGRPSIVGERGPELFVPSRSGTIIPNHAMGGASVTVNVDASGSQVQGNQPGAKALGSAIGAAVQAELIKQKRPGGLLAV